MYATSHLVIKDLIVPVTNSIVSKKISFVFGMLSLSSNINHLYHLFLIINYHFSYNDVILCSYTVFEHDPFLISRPIP